jgi:hypothetical protein
MEIIKGIEILDTCILINKKILVLADLHIGYEEALNKQGAFAPRIQFKETEIKLNEIFGKIKEKLDVIVINGDLKHEFGTISDQEWEETMKILDLLQKYCKQIVLVKGNHDSILGPIAKKRGLNIVESYIIGDVCIIHGDKILDNSSVLSAKILIIGHEHPAISIREEPKVEKYKCFLLGKYKKQQLIVMPSFLPIIEGTDIGKEKLLSPYLHQNLKNFEVFVVGDKTYRFGKLKNIL